MRGIVSHLWRRPVILQHVPLHSGKSSRCHQGDSSPTSKAGKSGIALQAFSAAASSFMPQEDPQTIATENKFEAPSMSVRSYHRTSAESLARMGHKRGFNRSLPRSNEVFYIMAEATRSRRLQLPGMKMNRCPGTIEAESKTQPPVLPA